MLRDFFFLHLCAFSRFLTVTACSSSVSCNLWRLSNPRLLILPMSWSCSCSTNCISCPIVQQRLCAIGLLEILSYSHRVLRNVGSHRTHWILWVLSAAPVLVRTRLAHGSIIILPDPSAGFFWHQKIKMLSQLIWYFVFSQCAPKYSSFFNVNEFHLH